MTEAMTLEQLLEQTTTPPTRVVSLVPSYTESMFDLGFGGYVVGITDFCSQPASRLKQIRRVGGPKNARVEEILSLSPELVLANQEENTQGLVEELAAAGVPVWLSFPKTVRDSMDVLWGMVELYHNETASMQVRMLEDAVKFTSLTAQDGPVRRVFCPIWQQVGREGGDWWMTFNQHTYPSDLLSLVGGKNIFFERERRYPLEADLGKAPAEAAGQRDTRYPCVTMEEVIAAQPEVILLPDEPYMYDEDDFARIGRIFVDTPAVRAGQVYRVDGSLLFWSGTRLGKALEDLPEYFLK